MNRNIKEQLDSTSELINTGKWDQALEQARADSENPELALSARTWFLLALIEGHHGTGKGRQAARKKATQCDDYSEELEGDLLRDDAIALMKNGYTQEAQEYVDRARGLHQHDQNRMICLKMVAGRIQLHNGHYDEAYKTLRDAAKEWKKMGKRANRQWQANLQLHLLMAAVMNGRRLKAWLVLPQLLISDRNRRRWFVAFHCLGSKRVCLSILRRY